MTPATPVLQKTFLALTVLSLSACGGSGSTGITASGSSFYPESGDPLVLWGTEGSLNNRPKSTGGQALCGAGDVRADDLATIEAKPPPFGSMPSYPISDALGECGNGYETLSWRLANCERISRDLEPLRCDLRLVWAGREHSRDMRERGYIGHTNPDGEALADRFRRLKITASYNAENISFAASSQPQTLADFYESSHHGLMDSPGHRANLLAPTPTHFGAGFAEGTSSYFDYPGQWVTQIFLK